MPGDLELEIAKWVKYYNNERLHESLDNVTPADMYFGRKEIILTQRQIIKQETLADRKRINLKSQRQVVLAN
ncbi:MAG: transposase [Candidatus Marinimicrobia bacterium]|nr:transposase [Candidatus Neomarinimicrobiota bacterium]MBT4398216.1 transposase [Bacteroidota bacterium]